MALRVPQSLEDLRVENDGIRTHTSNEQRETEGRVEELLAPYKAKTLDLKAVALNRDAHVDYLLAGLKGLSSGLQVLDASRPWLIYWITHSLDLLGIDLEPEEQFSVVETLRRCQHPDGGFGGGPGQLAHLAPTYAAVNALAIVGTEEAYGIIDRAKLRSWILRLKGEDGSFIMHEDGELDVRGAYCAASVASLCGLDVEAMFTGTTDWIARCQTYEGGIAAIPETEAHGGYAFCGLAAMELLGGTDKLDLDALLHWAVSRQMRLEGGFQGRTNKLVDGCYSFWVGAVFPLLARHLSTEKQVLETGWLYEQSALQDYVLIAGQDDRGGLRDKPGKPRDFYHTCYTLSGMSSAQYQWLGDLTKAVALVSHNEDCILRPTDPTHNVVISKAMKMKGHFVDLPVP